MLNNLLFQLKSPWGFMRIIRLVMALFLFYDGFMGENYWMFILASVLGYQALFNVGCASCAVPPAQYKNTKLPPEDVEIQYEEVK